MQMEILIFRSAAISKSIENYSPIAAGYEAQSWKRREYRFPESTIDSAYDHCLGGSFCPAPLQRRQIICLCCPPPITGISGINREQARKNGKALKNKDFRDAKRESAGCKL